jgi:hypothetical protein
MYPSAPCEYEIFAHCVSNSRRPGVTTPAGEECTEGSANEMESKHK